MTLVINEEGKNTSSNTKNNLPIRSSLRKLILTQNFG